MMLVYSKLQSPRLEYVLQFILEERLGLSFKITTDQQQFIASDQFRINYSEEQLTADVQIIPHEIIFEKGIREQQINVFHYNDQPAFFKNDAGYAFDIFSAVFFLISRYEEYYSFEEDMYGRYPHTASVAFKNNFLQTPLVNIWINDFAEYILTINPSLNIRQKEFKFIPTYDIDIAWSYKHKGFIRNVGGFIKNPSAERINVLRDAVKDPFDVYDELHALHQNIKADPVYFFLVAKQQGKYDKNISPDVPEMQQLIQQHSKYNIGVHPSWNSFDHPQLIEEEKKALENILRKKIFASRQHYIKMKLPETYKYLLNAGITDDYSMGYGSINGFRASVASSFLWYDLSEEKQTTLRLHPFCFMDANSLFEQKQSIEQSGEELKCYYNICKHVNGTLTTILHNNFLGSDPFYKGWKELYLDFTSRFQ